MQGEQAAGRQAGLEDGTSAAPFLHHSDAEIMRTQPSSSAFPILDRQPTFGQAAAVGAAQRIRVKCFQHAMPLTLPQRFRPRPAAAAAAVAVAGGAVVAVQWMAAVAAGRQARNAAVDAALLERCGGWRCGQARQEGGM